MLRAIHRSAITGCALSLALLAASCSSDAPKLRHLASTNNTDGFNTIAPLATPPSRCRAATTQFQTLTYAQRAGVDRNITSLDLYAAIGMRCAPVVAFVHGGGYCCGDKTNDIPAAAKWLTQHGYAVASINYRLIRGAGNAQYPAFNDDVATAIAWLRQHGPDVGIDPNRVVLVGHSTGGQMAAMVGVDEQYLERVNEHLNSLRCVALLDASGLDFADALAHGNNAVRSLYTKAFGDDATATAASPISHIAPNKSIAPFLIVMRGGEGQSKRASQAAFAMALRSASVDVTTVDASAITHAQAVTNIGEPSDRVITRPFFDFLTKCAVPNATSASVVSGSTTSSAHATGTTTLTPITGQTRGSRPSRSTSTLGAQQTVSQPTTPRNSSTVPPAARPTPNACVPPVRTVSYDVTYGPAQLDIYPTNARCQAPIALFVHGGGYLWGDKTSIAANVPQWFNARGYTFVSVNYRLKVLYPTFDNDVATAIAWLRNNASAYGADGSNVTLLGHSTGGDMVAELGTTPALMTSAGLTLNAIRCVAVLDAGDLDLEAMLTNPPSVKTSQLLQQVYGTDPVGWTQASALRNGEDGSDVAHFLVVIRAQQTGSQTAFVTALRANGVQVSTIDANSIGHGQVLDNIGTATDTVMTTPLLSFLRSCGG